METIDRLATDDATTLSLDDLASRMSAYRERAIAARRLADAVTDKGATTGLLAHAEEFEKKAEEIAQQIVRLAHTQDADQSGATPTSRPIISTARPKPR